MYPTISFYHEVSNEQFDVLHCDRRLYGQIDGEELSNDEMISVIDSLNESDKIKLIKACGGPKRFKHAYRKLYYENPVKVLDRELKELHSSSLEDYLELSYRAGLNPLPALRAKNIVVRFIGESTINPHFTDEDILVSLKDGYVTVIYNPWNSETEMNLINKGLKFQLEKAARLKEFNDRFEPEPEPKKRVIRKRIIKYSSED